MTDPACEAPKFNGQIVLIAESNPLIALDLAEMFRSWGARPQLYYDLVGSAQLAAPAMVQLAVIDIPHLYQPLVGLVDELRRRGVPTALTSVCGPEFVSRHFPGMIIFGKPVNCAALARRLNSAVQRPGPARSIRPRHSGEGFAWSRTSMTNRISCHG